jgi:uncharacterized protein (TIGR03382 family)
MKRHLVVATLLTLGMVSGLAHAAPRATYRWTDASRVGAKWEPPQAATVSHVIYLNNCKTGCTLHSGYDDSTTNASSIPSGTVNVPAYVGSDAQWQQIVSCVRQTYAPFNVQVVTDRPGAGTNYHMAIVAGTAASVGEQQGVLGVSPFSCGYIPNSISFTFANEDPTNIMDLCWTVSQETAHSWGLDHKYDNRDPMTYLQSGPAQKAFQNQAGACGEYSSRQCQCQYAQTGTAQENSYQLIMATFGSSAPDTTPPTVKITSPASNASVNAGFVVTANVNDDIAVGKAELRIDGNLIGTATGTPWQWNAPNSLGQGAHHVEVTAYDLANNTAKDAVDVAFGMVCTSDDTCTSGQVCLSGHCVAGPSQTGGLGTTCHTNSDCADGQCASDGTGASYCVETCDAAVAGACPSGFGCISTGASGVCWPGADNGSGGGGCNSGGDNGAILLGLGFAGMLFTRRRRR